MKAYDASMTRANGAVLYAGASLLDGAPIVAIATGLAIGSVNSKTGDTVQTYILRSDIEPTAALKSGADSAICGDCRHRGDGTGAGRTCYVNVGQGPLAVFRAWQRGRYPDAWDVPALGAGRVVRLGTYGDPAAVPVPIWRFLIERSLGHTGYTHQWRRAPTLRSLCMASVDNTLDALEAQRAGWRTFRVGMLAHSAVSRATLAEVLCPASAEAGKLLTCAQCLACGGADGRRGSVYIPAHGGFAVMANARRGEGQL
jgi:hypothetical protein